MSKYHVALSFAGEDRPFVEKVANRLREEGVNVFYDAFEEAELWGRDLYAHLTDIYQNRALFTVMFVSHAYSTKAWPNHERRGAQARALSASREYILPAVFDESIEVPGLLKTTSYVSLKSRTPEQLAALIVQKLVKSGVVLSQRFAYAEQAKADVDFPSPKGTEVGDIIRALKSYTWQTQHPAVVRLLELDWSKINADEAFVLGRNLYQAACGSERRAEAALRSLRRELAAIPEDRALDLLNGMLFEVYFNSAGEFRGANLKAGFLDSLLSLQTVKKYEPSIAFIRRALEPYRGSLLVIPSTEPETITAELSIRKSDPPTIRSLKVNGRNFLVLGQEDLTPSARLWRLSYQSFTVKELRDQLAEHWGIPSSQLELAHSPPFEPTAKLRLPDGANILSPAEVANAA